MTCEKPIQVSANQTFEPFTTVFRVSTHTDLASALKQRTAPIVIANPGMARWFWVWMQVPILIAALVAYAISRGYGVEFKATEWSGHITAQQEIVLTPK